MSEPAASWERLADRFEGLIIGVTFGGVYPLPANAVIPPEMVQFLRGVLSETAPSGVVYDISNLDASCLDAFAALVESHLWYGGRSRAAAIVVGSCPTNGYAFLGGRGLSAAGVEIFERKEEALSHLERTLVAMADKGKADERSGISDERLWPQRADLQPGAATAFPDLHGSALLGSPFLLVALAVFIASILAVPPLADRFAARGYRGAGLLIGLQMAPALLVLLLPGLWNALSRERWSRRFRRRIPFARLRAILAAEPDRFAIHLRYHGGGFDMRRLAPDAVVEDLTTGELTAIYPSSTRVPSLCDEFHVRTASYF